MTRFDLRRAEPPFEVLRRDDPAILARFDDRERAFDFARAFAVRHRCDMTVRGPLPEVVRDDRPL
jgi:hypothetical protein